ncbi:MAG: glutathione S-transferase family protein [Ostreibacterium sp.]
MEERSKKRRKAFDKLEQKLAGSSFFKGDSISMVDIAWLPILHRSNDYQSQFRL